MTFPVAHILCVDDDDDSCELIKYMLQAANDGYEVVSATGIEKALALIENQSFDLYILDYALPDGTGVELCGKIRQIDSNTPIMFFSAMAREIDRNQALAQGADRYLVKPNDLDKFTNVVEQLLTENSPVL